MTLRWRIRLVLCWLAPSLVFRVLYRQRCYYRVEYPQDETLRVYALMGADADGRDWRSLRAFAAWACRRLAAWDAEFQAEWGTR